MEENKELKSPEELLEYLRENLGDKFYRVLEDALYSWRRKDGDPPPVITSESDIKDGYYLAREEWPEDFFSTVGPIKQKAQFGGVGQGDDYWVVFEFEKFGCLIRVDGFYMSYEGHELDGDPYIVVEKTKEITVYEKP